jgi:hypothetical protein
MIDRRILGKSLSDKIVFAAACNPYRTIQQNQNKGVTSNPNN